MSKGVKKDLFAIKTIDTSKTNFFKTIEKNETFEKGSTEEVTLVALNKVCERYENLFIQDPLALKGLVNSVKEIGFTDPIRVMRIEDKLAASTSAQLKKITAVNKEYMTNEFDYLLKKKDEGYNYVVVSGHRRLQAAFTIAMETLLNKTPDYSSDVEKSFRDIQDELFEKFYAFNKSYIPNFDYEKDDEALKYETLYIPCIVVDNKEIDFDKEDRMYKDTNITTREITQFEIIINLYKELLRKGELDNFKKVNGTYNYASIANYMNEKYSKNINADTLRRTVQINNELPEDFLELIYCSKLSLNQAKYLLPKFSLLSKKQIDFIKDKLVNDADFNLQKWLKETFDKPKAKRQSATKKRFIELLVEIKTGKKTVDEVIEIMNNW